MEVKDNSLPIIQDVPQSLAGIVIDLTASSPPPVIKEESIDNSGMTSVTVPVAFDSDIMIIDLTMDSDDN